MILPLSFTPIVFILSFTFSTIAIFLQADELISGDQEFFIENVNSDTQYTGHLRYMLWINFIKFVGLDYFLNLQSVLFALANSFIFICTRKIIGKNSVIICLIITCEPLLTVFSASYMRDCFLYSMIAIAIYLFLERRNNHFYKILIFLLVAIVSLMRIQVMVSLTLSILLFLILQLKIFRNIPFISVIIFISSMLYLSVIYFNAFPPSFIRSEYLSGGSDSIIQYITNADNEDEAGGILSLGYIKSLDYIEDFMQLAVIMITNPFLSWSLPFPNRFTSLFHIVYLLWGLIYGIVYIRIMFVKLTCRKLQFLRLFLFIFTILTFSFYSNIGSILRTRLCLLPVILIFSAYLLNQYIYKKNLKIC